MSNIELVIEERAAHIGNFMVGRLLPFRQKRMVGPFVFIDHMGPINIDQQISLDVDPHPHIGLSTLTYLFDGEIIHKDSIGSVQKITPGAVNWMTAGKGVVHSERIPKELKQGSLLHGLQIWVALPKELEQTNPTFQHVEASELPSWKHDNVSYKLIAGEALGYTSPVSVYSPLYFIEIKSTEQAMINIGEGLFGESAMYILEGAIKSEEHTYTSKHILIANNSKLCSFEMQANTTVYIFGGEPLTEQRLILWNFVSYDQNRLDKAKQDWIDQNHQVFPLIQNDNNSYIPFPEQFNNFRPKSI